MITRNIDEIANLAFILYYYSISLICVNFIQQEKLDFSFNYMCH